jgi:flagellar hook assembly protein FlgD
MEIYNLIGQRVRSWPASWREAGFHEQQWDGLNDASLPVSSGEYFLRVSMESAGGERLVRTVMMSVVR